MKCSLMTELISELTSFYEQNFIFGCIIVFVLVCFLILYVVEVFKKK